MYVCRYIHTFNQFTTDTTVANAQGGKSDKVQNVFVAFCIERYKEKHLNTERVNVWCSLKVILKLTITVSCASLGKLLQIFYSDPNWLIIMVLYKHVFTRIM